VTPLGRADAEKQDENRLKSTSRRGIHRCSCVESASRSRTLANRRQPSVADLPSVEAWAFQAREKTWQKKGAFSPGPSLARHEVRAAQSLNRARSGPRASLQTCPPKPCHPPPGGTDDPVGALRSSHLKFQISDFRSPLLRSPFRRSRLYFWFTFLALAPSRATVLPHPFSRACREHRPRGITGCTRTRRRPRTLRTRSCFGIRTMPP
jgi:hypothetical protein